MFDQAPFSPKNIYSYIRTMSDYSLRQVITSGKRANVNSYETLMEATFGRPGFVFLSFNMFFLSYGAMLAYLTIIKDVLPILFGVAPDDEYMKRSVLVISSLVIILPLSMQRDMADLEKTSRLNVFLNLALVGIVTGYSPVLEKVEMEGGLLEVIKQEMVFDTKRFFVGFGVASFAFVSESEYFALGIILQTRLEVLTSVQLKLDFIKTDAGMSRFVLHNSWLSRQSN